MGPACRKVPHGLRRLLAGGEAAVVLAAVSVAVRLLPEPHLARLVRRSAANVPRDESADAVALARFVGRAVERVAAVLPWRPACLVRAVASAVMLRRRAIASEIHLGITGTEPVAAHAWVTVAGTVIEGGRVEVVVHLGTYGGAPVPDRPEERGVVGWSRRRSSSRRRRRIRPIRPAEMRQTYGREGPG